MKKFLLLVVLVLSMFGMQSCGPDTREEVTTTTTTAEKVTYSDGGFYVEQQMIVSGNTVWGISDRVYGTGTKWRDIIALNPFLNSPDRLYYNTERKMWIVRIFPGEVLNIGGQKVYPSCTYEKTTTTTTIKHTPAPVFPWWEWAMIVLAVIVLLLLLARLIWPVGFASAFASSNSSVHVNLNQPGGIDVAVQRAILERSQAMEQELVSTISKGAERGNLKEFCVFKTPETFMAAGSFRKGCPQTTEPKKEEGKQ